MTDILTGLGRHAALLGHGTWRTGTPYGPDEVGIVIGDVTPRPDRLLAVRAYQSGAEPDAGLAFDEPYVQWRIRDLGEDAARSRAQALYVALHGAGRVVLPGGVVVMSIIATHPGPLPLGRDQAGRHEFTVNTRVDHLR